MKKVMRKLLVIFTLQLFLLCIYFVTNVKRFNRIDVSSGWPIPLTEEEARSSPPYTDYRTLACSNNSVVQLLGETKVFELGYEIRVLIHIKDLYNNSKSIGGDMIRIWMKEEANEASVAGYVIDLHNGSYVGVLKAMWVGSPNIIVSIAATRESIKFFYDTYHKYRATKNISAVYINPATNKTIEAVCSPEPFVLGYQDVCNMTERNHGVSWYCGRPNLPDFECQHYTGCKSVSLNPLPQLDSRIFKQNFLHAKLPQVINVQVISKINDDIYKTPKTACNKIPSQITWSHPVPSGFFYKSKWYSTYCNNNHIAKFRPDICLRNRKLWLFGDSTTRQWFYRINTQYNIGNILHRKTWHAPLSVTNSAWNFTLFWGPHEQPFSSLDKSRVIDHVPAHVYMKDISNTSSDIVVLCMYSHLTHYHPTVFANRLEHLYKGVVDLIARAPNVTVLFKGYHTFKDQEMFARWHDDYFGLLYQEMVKAKCLPIKNHVTYLNHWDMTISAENSQLHPTKFLDDIMLNKLFSHVCSD